MRVIVFDKTGTVTAAQAGGPPATKRRRDYLQELLRQKQVEFEPWADPPSTLSEPSQTVLLAHLSDLTDSVESQLDPLAEKGGLVVIYTEGQVTEKEKSKGAGWVYWRRWYTLEEAVSSLPEEFGQRDLKNVLDNPPQRNLLVAVTILSWCASATVEDRAGRQRQKQWRESREKWQQVFKDVSEREFLQAVGPERLDSPNWPDGLSNVEHLVKWVKWVKPEVGGSGGPPEPAPPDHAAVLKELQRTFRWKL
jgi:hypothetical protein